MPLDEIILPHFGVRVAFWKITESEDELLQMYAPNPLEESTIKSMKGERKKHFLASRLLSRAMFPNCDIQKDEHGKPHLVPNSAFISWSHSGEYAAFISNNTEATGVDIETVNSRIIRIQDKFCNHADNLSIINQFQAESLLMIWAAKESLFKLYGKKEVDFRRHMTVEPFMIEKEGRFIAKFHKDNLMTFEMEYRFFNGYIAVWVNKLLND